MAFGTSGVVRLAAVVIGLSVISGETAAADPIEERQQAMKTIGRATTDLGKILKGEMEFSGETVAARAATILENLSAAEQLFPEGSTSDDSRAKPEIWQDLDAFVAALNNAKEKAEAVQETGQANDEAAFRAAVAELGGACKGCHDKFRKPED